ncbi:hypothetical protein ABIB62_004576 [Mucilaginibacter sp. UYP25]
MINKIFVVFFLNIFPLLCFSQQAMFMLERKPLNVIDSLESKSGGVEFKYNYQIRIAKIICRV